MNMRIRPDAEPLEDDPEYTGEEVPPGTIDQDEHEGATDEQVSDRGGPGVGYDQEPEKVKDKGGVA